MGCCTSKHSAQDEPRCCTSKHSAQDEPDSEPDYEVINDEWWREAERRTAETARLIATSQQVGEYVVHSFPIEFSDKDSMQESIREKVLDLMLEHMGASRQSSPEEIVVKTVDGLSPVATTWPPSNLSEIEGLDELKVMGEGSWPMMVEIKLKPVRPEDPGATLKLFKNTNFAERLACGDIAVVRSSYFQRCLQNGENFADRANIPEEYIFTGHEVMVLWMRFGFFFLVVISYGWLAKNHPDPHKYHLRRLVRILKELKRHAKREFDYDSGAYDGDLGVILDFCSLWQKDENGYRSEERTASFARGLTEINTPYAHRNIAAIKMTGVPKGVSRKYEDRGWTFFESSIIQGKAQSDKHFWGQHNVITCDASFDPDGEQDTGCAFITKYCKNDRKPILTPDDFTEGLAELGRRAEAKSVPLFTSGKDQPMILKKYADSFGELAALDVMSYRDMGWADAEALQLCKALRHSHMLKTLILSGNRISDKGAEEIATAITGKTSLKELLLHENKIADSGAIALATAMTGLTNLQIFLLWGNQFTDDGAMAFATAIPSCTSLKEVRLDYNRHGDKGHAALQAAKDQCPHIENENFSFRSSYCTR